MNYKSNKNGNPPFGIIMALISLLLSGGCGENDTLAERIERKAAVSQIATPQVTRREVTTRDDNGQPVRRIIELPVNQSALVEIAKNDKDNIVRQVAVSELIDQAVLVEIAKNDKDGPVRFAAVLKLTDQAVLAEVARNDENMGVRKAAVEKLTDQAVLMAIVEDHNEYAGVKIEAIIKLPDRDVRLVQLMETIYDPPVHLAIVTHITDQTILSAIAKGEVGIHSEVHIVAIKKLTDQSVLSEIALGKYEKLREKNHYVEKSRAEVRQAAMETLTDQTVLAEIAEKDRDANVRQAAIKKLTDQSALAKIAEVHEDRDVRRAAVNRLEELKKR